MITHKHVYKKQTETEETYTLEACKICGDEATLNDYGFGKQISCSKCSYGIYKKKENFGEGVKIWNKLNS